MKYRGAPKAKITRELTENAAIAARTPGIFSGMYLTITDEPTVGRAIDNLHLAHHHVLRG
jgi:hypothetical protein